MADADPELHRRWTDKVPVVLLDGELHAYWQVDEMAPRRALHLSPLWVRQPRETTATRES